MQLAPMLRCEEPRASHRRKGSSIAGAVPGRASYGPRLAQSCPVAPDLDWARLVPVTPSDPVEREVKLDADVEPALNFSHDLPDNDARSLQVATCRKCWIMASGPGKKYVSWPLSSHRTT